MAMRPRLAALLLAACLPLLNACRTDDLPGMDDGGNGTPTTPPEELVGKPVCFGGLTVTEVTTDATTRAITRTTITAYNKLGATMTVKMTVKIADGTSVTQYADYTCINDATKSTAVWTLDSGSQPLRWQHIINAHTFTAYLPALTAEEKTADRNSATPLVRTVVLPEKFTFDNYLKYDYLTRQTVTSTITSNPIVFPTMKHLMVRIEVTGISGKIYHTDMDLFNIYDKGETTFNNSIETITHGTGKGGVNGLWKDGNTFRGFLMPGQTLKSAESVLVSLPDKATYSISTEGGSSVTLTAGQVLKVTIENISNLKKVTNTTAGKLSLPATWASNDSQLAISGPLNETDIAALKTYLKNNPAITGIYIDMVTGLTSLPDETFSDCTNLRVIYLPESITTIGARAFQSTTSLQEMPFPSGLKEIKHDAFSHSSLIEIALPEGLTALGEGAFAEMNKLKKVTLPDGLKEIGYATFHGCSSLADIRLPENLETLGKEAFDGCAMLTNLYLPAKLKNLGWCTLRNCTKLTTIVILSSDLGLGMNAFENCTSLVNLVMPTIKVQWQLGDHFKNTPIASGSGILFLTDIGITIEEQLRGDGGNHLGINNTHGITWKTIYYGYTGKGDITNPANYRYQYSNP